MDNKIIVLCGKSSVGKDTISKLIEDLGYNFIVSTTTRPMREKETEGNPYYFVDNDRFLYLIANNELLEFRSYNTLVNNNPAIWYYGIESKYIKDNERYIGVLDIDGLEAIKKLYGDRVISFYIYADEEDRLNWAKSRGSFNETEWKRREIADRKDFSSERISICDFVVLNKDINKCFQEIKERIGTFQ